MCFSYVLTMLLVIYVHYDDYINFFFNYTPRRIEEYDLQYFVHVPPFDEDICLTLFPLLKCNVQF